MFRFLHAADVHLDSPLKGLAKYDGAPVETLRLATRRALENLVRLAIDEKVQFVVIAGDLYDGDWRDFNTGLFFVSMVGRLRDAGIPLFVIAGNHDAANQMTRSLRLPANPDGSLPLLPPGHVETRRLEQIGVLLHGRSFATAAESSNLAREYPPGEAGWFHIGVLHTSLEGDSEHATYAPCSLDDLRSKGYDYWALGHIHRRREVAWEPPIVYPGNVQGRHVRETGPKGCYLVSVNDQHQVSLQFRTLDVFRWATCEVDCSGAADSEELLERFRQQLLTQAASSDDLPFAVRVTLTGAGSVHRQLAGNPEQWQAELRSAAMDVTEGRAWVERVDIRTRGATVGPVVPAAASRTSDIAGVLGEIVRDDSLLASLSDALSSLRSRLPSELIQPPEALVLDDPDWLRSVWQQAEALLAERLDAQEPD